MAAEGMQFPWRCDGGTISTNLNVIWGMSVEGSQTARYSEIEPNFLERIHDQESIKDLGTEKNFIITPESDDFFIAKNIRV